MDIKEHRLRLFIELYKQDFGITLTREEAYEKASALLHYTKLFIKPLAKAIGDDINDMSNINL
jgi:hypothetical protein